VAIEIVAEDVLTRLNERLRTAIPLTSHLGVRAVYYDGEILRIAAPLLGNTNHKATAFGGSLFSVAVLAGWGLVTLKVEGVDLYGDVVVQDANVTYEHPVTGDFTATASLAPDTDFNRFATMLRRRRRARCEVVSKIEFGGTQCLTLTGSFAAIA
jgi:thioesterase domain-containing protein